MQSTATPSLSAGAKKRGAVILPSAIPKPAVLAVYVGSALSSACSCLSIPTPTSTATATATAQTTTTPIIQSTSTTTFYTTVTSTRTSNKTSFYISAGGLPTGSPYANKYAALFTRQNTGTTTDYEYLHAVFNASTQLTATSWYLNSSCHLQSTANNTFPGAILAQAANDYNPHVIFFRALPQLTSQGYTVGNCTVNAMNVLTCALPEGNVSGIYNGTTVNDSNDLGLPGNWVSGSQTGPMASSFQPVAVAPV
ncbi:hypothetical protein MRB53_038253 [Persea americana]|nr:hypothetical protein MRB53_038253 [Persea americana]